MIRRYFRKFIPVGIRTFISKLESYFLFDIYAHRLLGPRLNKRLNQRQQPSQYLFLMSPARSGSSLLGHVLFSHPEITGYGESHVGYSSRLDLRRLVYRTAAVLDDFDPLGYTYAVDKIVWNYPVAEHILRNQRVKFIFLLRDPAATYTSTVKSFSGHESPKEVDKWVTYYGDRLAYLENMAIGIDDPSRCLTLRYEDLLGDTDRTLAELQSFLGTTTPFSDSYRVAKHTSRAKYGDSSQSIRAGKILRQRFQRPTLNSEVFALEKQQQVYDLYRGCLTTLQQHTQLSSAMRV